MPEALEALARFGVLGRTTTVMRRDSSVQPWPLGPRWVSSDGRCTRWGMTTPSPQLGKRWEKKDFDAAWAEGAALSGEEAIAYAQRGRGERKRPASGWESLTPTEREVVGLVGEGLGNKDIGARLFISPRTVQTHLTHVYAKLALESRMQLVQEVARHA